MSMHVWAVFPPGASYKKCIKKINQYQGKKRIKNPLYDVQKVYCTKKEKHGSKTSLDNYKIKSSQKKFSIKIYMAPRVSSNPGFCGKS